MPHCTMKELFVFAKCEFNVIIVINMFPV